MLEIVAINSASWFREFVTDENTRIIEVYHAPSTTPIATSGLNLEDTSMSR